MFFSIFMRRFVLIKTNVHKKKFVPIFMVCIYFIFFDRDGLYFSLSLEVKLNLRVDILLIVDITVEDKLCFFSRSYF
jgi:hypothetical protein